MHYHPCLQRDALISSGRPNRSISTTRQSVFSESRISWKEIMVWIYRLMWPLSRSRLLTVNGLEHFNMLAEVKRGGRLFSDTSWTTL